MQQPGKAPVVKAADTLLPVDELSRGHPNDQLCHGVPVEISRQSPPVPGRRQQRLRRGKAPAPLAGVVRPRHREAYQGEAAGVFIEAAVPQHGAQQAGKKVLPPQLRIRVQIGQQIHQHAAVQGALGQHGGVDEIRASLGAQLRQKAIPLLLGGIIAGLQLDAVLRVGVVEEHDGIPQLVGQDVGAVAAGEIHVDKPIPGVPEDGQGQGLFRGHHGGRDADQAPVSGIEEVSGAVFQHAHAPVLVGGEGGVQPTEDQGKLPGLRVKFAEAVVLGAEEASPLAGKAAVDVQRDRPSQAQGLRVKEADAIPLLLVPALVVYRVAGAEAVALRQVVQLRAAQLLCLPVHQVGAGPVKEQRPLAVQGDEVDKLAVEIVVLSLRLLSVEADEAPLPRIALFRAAAEDIPVHPGGLLVVDAGQEPELALRRRQLLQLQSGDAAQIQIQQYPAILQGVIIACVGLSLGVISRQVDPVAGVIHAGAGAPVRSAHRALQPVGKYDLRGDKARLQLCRRRGRLRALLRRCAAAGAEQQTQGKQQNQNAFHGVYLLL